MACIPASFSYKRKYKVLEGDYRAEQGKRKPGTFPIQADSGESSTPRSFIQLTTNIDKFNNQHPDRSSHSLPTSTILTIRTQILFSGSYCQTNNTF
jgi:hypothetical protein